MNARVNKGIGNCVPLPSPTPPPKKKKKKMTKKIEKKCLGLIHGPLGTLAERYSHYSIGTRGRERLKNALL